MKTKKSLTRNNDKSPIIYQRSKIKQNLNILQRNFTENQKNFLEIALNKETKMIFLSGPAGTAKTYLSIYSALTLMNEKRVSDLIYLRSAVESSDSKLGFLPGEMDEKMNPYIQPLLDKLSELLPKNEIDVLKKEERVTAIPINYLRGLNWNAKCVILDESQNCSRKELVTFITRIGEFSKVFIIGDPEQSDINGKSGFIKLASDFDDEESRQHGIYTFKFTTEDVVRSGLVKYIVDKLNKLKS